VAQPNDTGRLRLLAVDDDDNCGDLIVRTALRCGYEAFPISDAGILEKTIDHWQPHLITLDLCMPNVDGLEIIWRLKRTCFDGQLIIISGQPERLRIRATDLACANGFKVPAQLVKPIQLTQLRDLLTIIRAGLLATEQPNSVPLSETGSDFPKPVMQDCIFCSIIGQKRECSLVYNDERTIAFLSTTPVNPGHTLVMPKAHYEDIFHIPAGELLSLLEVASRVSAAINNTLNPIRVGLVAMGLDVQHAHFHLVPLHSRFDITSKTELEGRLVTLSQGELDKVAETICANLKSERGH
jgi:histidine triad (HIT) family protein